MQINDANADVVYAGSAPGMVSGIFQINVRVPDFFSPPPMVPIVLTIGGISNLESAPLMAVE